MNRHRLGETADGGYVVVDIELEEEASEGEWQTITHEPVIGPKVRFSIMGAQYGKGARRDNPSRSGQIQGSLSEVTEPAPGWTLKEIAELDQIWARWHLNDMRSGCVHVPTPVMETGPYGPRADLKNTPPCPETGYRYGQAWLYEPLPDEVVEAIKRLDRDRSHDLYVARGYDLHGHKYPTEEPA